MDGAVAQQVAALLQRLKQLAPDQQQLEVVAAALMQQWLAATACVACLGLLLSTIAVGWCALWHTTMKDVGFFREVLGLNRPKPEVKAQSEATMAAQITEIKRQHQRSSARSVTSRQPSAQPT